MHIQNEPINEPPSNRQTAEINVKNIKNDKILREKHLLILGNVHFLHLRKPRKRVKYKITKPRIRVKSSTLKARIRATTRIPGSYET